MRHTFKTDFETFFMSNQTKYPTYYEGQTYKNDHDLIFIKFIPISVKRPAVSCEQHDVIVRFHIFSNNVLQCDKIVDDLSALLSDRNIDNMEFRTLETFQRGNKHGDVWETIADIRFYHWSTPVATVDALA